MRMRSPCFLLVCVLSVCFLSKGLQISAAENFDTNMNHWRGVESTWTETENGYTGSTEKNEYDFAVSDSSVDCTKDFLYSVTLEKTDGYGAGLAIGIKDASSREAIRNSFIYFIADPDNVYYNVFKNGESITGPMGRALTAEEKQSKRLTFSAKYSTATASVIFALNGVQIETEYTDVEIIKGQLGIIAHAAQAHFQRAQLTVTDAQQGATGGFETNMTNWAGVESIWTETPAGYLDGTEQSVFDFAFSDVLADGSTSFTYTVQMERINGYGFGLVFAAPDKSSRDAVMRQYIKFIVDPLSITYSIKDGEAVGRQLTEDEKCPAASDITAEPMLYTFVLEYYAEDAVVEFYLNENLIEVYYPEDGIAGYLGLVAHDARVRVKSAIYEEHIATPTPEQTPTQAPTETPSATTAPAETPTKAPAVPSAAHAGEQAGGADKLVLWVVLAVIAAAGIAAAGIIIVKKKRS